MSALIRLVRARERLAADEDSTPAGMKYAIVSALHGLLESNARAVGIIRETPDEFQRTKRLTHGPCLGGRGACRQNTALYTKPAGPNG